MPLFRLALLQFVTLAAIGMVAAYTNLYLIDVGFSATLIGTLGSVGAVLTLTLTPLLGHFADRKMQHRRLFMAYMLLFILSNLLFANTTTTLLLIVAVMLSKIAIQPSMMLSMQLTMTQIAGNTKVVLGQIRSFSALGFGAASLFAGQIFGWGGYTLLFWIGALFALIAVQVSTIFPASSNIREKPKSQPVTQRHRGFYVLLASQFFTRMGVGNSFVFMFIHFSQNLGIPTNNIGMWAAFLAVIEMPFFVMADSFLPKIKSRHAYVAGSVGMGLFILLLGLAPSRSMLVLLLLFRGLAFPIYFLASYNIVAEISAPHNLTTNNAILLVTMPNIALLLTGTAFGWIFDNYGAFTFFALCGASCLIGAGVTSLFGNHLNTKKTVLAK